jgi:hypothetical protein
VLKIEDITSGDSKKDYLVRYRGTLLGDSAEAYDRLSQLLSEYEITPLFRMAGSQHAILLIPGVIRPKPSKKRVNIILFALTVLSVIFAGALYGYTGPEPNSISEFLAGIMSSLPSGLAFAASLLAILLAHEFGHYLAGRYHKTHVTLPYFIPFPLTARLGRWAPSSSSRSRRATSASCWISGSQGRSPGWWWPFQFCYSGYRSPGWTRSRSTRVKA